MAFARTTLLMAFLTALFMGVGYLIGGLSGAVIALAGAAATNLYAFWTSDTAVLKRYQAQPIPPNDRMGLHAMTKEMVDRAGMPMPALYLIDTPQPNAFATGRNPQNAAVAVTKGLLERLNREEVAGVIAHELAHIENRDTLTMTVTATLAGAISMLANFAFLLGGRRDSPLGIFGVIAMTILAPIAAMMVQTAISRTREYEADADGARICGRPEWLASALQKIAGAAARIDNNRAERHPASAHMFIVNPLHGHAFDGLFKTHPPTERRVEELMKLARSAGTEPVARSSVPRSGRRVTEKPWG